MESEEGKKEIIVVYLRYSCGSLKLYNFMYNHKAKDFSVVCVDRKRKSLSDSKKCGCNSTVEHSPVTREVVGSAPSTAP